jgi:hypothetical protein
VRRLLSYALRLDPFARINVQQRAVVAVFNLVAGAPYACIGRAFIGDFPFATVRHFEKLAVRDVVVQGEANAPIGDPDSHADFSDARAGLVPPPQSTKLITTDDEANYGIELIDLAMRAAKEAMAPELNAVRQEAMSQLAAMPACAM